MDPRRDEERYNMAKPTIKAVTTFNAAGHELYGKKLLESWRLWPKSVSLTVYQEGFDIEGGKELLDISWLVEFKRRNKNKRFQDFRWDAVRFAHKTAAVIDAAQNADYLIWIDGDVYTHSRISEERLSEWLPDEEYISWLWREKIYPECGFYILNLKHSKHSQIMREWQRLYESDDVYRLAEWHDSFVFAYVIKQFGVKWKSLSGDFAWHSHPFINGPLGAFMDHAKGPRKNLGRSSHRDLAVKRTEDHWNEQAKGT